MASKKKQNYEQKSKNLKVLGKTSRIKVIKQICRRWKR